MALCVVVGGIGFFTRVEARSIQPGTIVEGNANGDPQTFNPLFAYDAPSARIASLLFPQWIGINAESGVYEPNRPDALVTSWQVSADGRAYTFHLRDDWAWSDGTPITSEDIAYSWNAIASDQTYTYLSYLRDDIEGLKAPDPYTVVVRFKSADCSALATAASIPVLPAHVLPSDFGELNEADFNQNPTVTGGIFNFESFAPGVQVSLVANPNYGGASVRPQHFIYKIVPDQLALAEEFLAGEINVIDNPSPNNWPDILDADVQTYRYPGNTWDYLALNHADPTNPQDAYAADGRPIEQGHHPLFGDVRVRQAVAKAIDVDSLIQKVAFGYATRMTSTIIPASWAYDPDLQPIPYDVEGAAQLLQDAGWVDQDADETTPRICQGCMYAEDGTPFEFTLYTNLGGIRRDSIATGVQDNLRQIGIEVDLQIVEFTTLFDIINAQTFDAYILGWRDSYPHNPDQSMLFSSASDVLGGTNSISYNNPQLDDLLNQARYLPNCDQAERTEIYHQTQKILQDDVAYVPLFALDGLYAAQSSVNGFSPYPNALYWNVDTWNVSG